jgi:glycosyltransferase involved in cell wall biosynthesis
MFGGSGFVPISVNRRIKVLHFSCSTVRGGAEEHMLTLLRSLDRARFQPLLAAHRSLIELLHPDLPGEVEVIPVSLASARDLDAAARLVRLLRQKAVGVVHSHMFQSSRLASPLAWLAGVPVVIETPHIREQWRRGWIKGSYSIDRLVGRFVTKYIAVSKANRDYLVNEKRLPANKVVVVRNGISLERFDTGRAPPAELRRALGIAENAPIVVVAARLEPQKGHRILFDAWRLVTQSFPQARLLVVGEGSLRDQLRTYSVRLNIDRSVVFAGYQKNVPDWLALAHFSVLPSFYEGLPLVALESLAAARAVVATAVDGTAEVVIDGETGLLAPPGESVALSAAISKLIASPELARNMGRAGRRLVEEHFSERRQVSETEAVYEAALRRHLGSTSSGGFLEGRAA